ncbi:C4-dicarboxylate TRAP transporter substrate-binding protein [Aquisalimonas sp.]|uniref:C4-dicarboxylate TRAP transporter substrate-binding protein n=1 Tax=unclassified Aquisalimonas TaxID=2644645 RepID=UPI0025C0E150|nr:C4-dicarboxylate TRAP transporter substrate-binding protein [Aquisalimonas sp.]
MTTTTITRVSASALVAAGLLLGGASAADARQLNYASGYPDGSIGIEAAERWADAVEEYSDGALSARVFPLSLLDFEEASSGVRDGIADSAFVLLPYFQSEYPHANMVAEISMALELADERTPGHEGLAYAGAMSEFIFNHCPECVEEFEAQNQLFLGGSSSTSYHLICTEEVTSLDDLQGTRVRAGGAQWSRWADALGASSVSMSVNDMYEALSQGVLDCASIDLTGLTIFSLSDVATDITVQVPGGAYGGSSPASLNLDTWRSLDTDGREALMRAATVMSAELSYLYAEEDIANHTLAEQEGIAIHEPDDALLEASHDFIREDLETIASRYQERGVDRAEEMIAEFRPLLDRWLKLVEDVDDADELARLYWDEVSSKVDVDSYGM